MVIDTTGTILTPGNLGKDCGGNGENEFEICCDECDFYLCCLDENYPQRCTTCRNNDCPRKK